ncbi:uncharacterized protein L969DRAFT_55032 [Mixia osmundae IAM 14324]|uniref:tRNA ligase kinase domain-containing protein n=1 Tax=Mixia osmundae (strain CBS 9802 / IAM 14324 / JCM 22182 / KY 12970) TaxID=764103 RepID=G7EB64_MIXOS|nr:uncharacterized protein L969DRAFT_55032 [Mixia osmundae IAM 14324]KEI36558.1 hypothetical protein L969DRAFT_55032 [Mixia osmundae IAM 14324]GAB00075.1 hypothetical protein E5Q_06777 [Mixia osmundae IAM 14324]
MDLPILAAHGHEQARQQQMLVLCGVIGSGKSTLADGIVSRYPQYKRICQDVLGDRRSCEAMAELYLSQGLSVIIDRQNFDIKQRKPFVSIAARLNVSVLAIVFSTPQDVCKERLLLRKGHETIQTPQEAMRILPMVLRDWQTPTAREGFHGILTLPACLPADAPRFVLEQSAVMPSVASQPAYIGGRAFAAAPRAPWAR